MNIPKGRLVEAFKSVFAAYLNSRPANSSQISEEIVNAVRAYIDSNAARFIPISDFHTNKRSNVVGYRIEVAGRQAFLFLDETFAKIAATFGSEQVLNALEQAGLLLRTESSRKFQARIPSRGASPSERKRFYAIYDEIRFEAASV
ncbi:MAG: hypothetical protein EON56_03590 [Alphaproteobacteria bacterium]|nr:MAG: hypothetical protein EON56_03590 [Alphaproteobacteria bacterium]